MDNGVYNHKVSAKSVALTRSSINNNFALAPNGANGFRYSSIETSGGSGSSDISSNSSGCEIRTKNRTVTHRQATNFVNYNDNYNDHNYRWTVNPVDKIGKSFVDTKAINISCKTVTNNSKYSDNDKGKWTQKCPFNGNISM